MMRITRLATVGHRVSGAVVALLLFGATAAAATLRLAQGRPEPSREATISEVADAAMRGDREAVRAALARKADVNAAQVDGTTALHWAVELDDVELAELLLTAGAGVSARTRDRKSTRLNSSHSRASRMPSSA